MEEIINLIKDLSSKKFTGSVQINFSNGGIANVNCNQTIKANEIYTVIRIAV